MRFRTHVKPEHKNLAGPNSDEYSDGIVEHDLHVGELLKRIDDLGLTDNTIVQYSTDNGPHYNTWPDAGTTPFLGEKNSNWEGAFRVPYFVKWSGKFPAGVTLNGIVAHEDWLPTFAAAVGAPDIKEKLLKGGVELNGRTYKNQYRRLQSARLSKRQGEGITTQRVHLSERCSRHCRHPSWRLEGNLLGKPGASIGCMARAVRPLATAAALQPTS